MRIHDISLKIRKISQCSYGCTIPSEFINEKNVDEKMILNIIEGEVIQDIQEYKCAVCGYIFPSDEEESLVCPSCESENVFKAEDEVEDDISKEDEKIDNQMKGGINK